MKASLLAIAVAFIPLSSSGCLDALQSGGGSDQPASCPRVEDSTATRSATLECSEYPASGGREIQTQLQLSQLSSNTSFDLRSVRSPAYENFLNSRLKGNSIDGRGSAMTSILFESFSYLQVAFHA